MLQNWKALKYGGLQGKSGIEVIEGRSRRRKMIGEIRRREDMACSWEVSLLGR